MHVTQNLPNLEKCPPFLQFLSKLSDFLFVKDLSNRLLFFWSLASGSIIFWLGCDDWKMDELFQHPLGPISLLNFPKISFHQKKFEKFWWKLKEYTPYPYPMYCRSLSSPPPACFRVKESVRIFLLFTFFLCFCICMHSIIHGLWLIKEIRCTYTTICITKHLPYFLI